MTTHAIPATDPIGSPPVGDRAATANRNAVDAATANRKAARFWGLLVIGLLGTQVIIGVGSVFIAIGDPSVAIVPNYYEKALNWDEEMATRASSDLLGWQCAMTVSEGTDRNGARTLLVKLDDRDAKSISDASVGIQLYHHARASELQTIELRPQGNGLYTGMATMPRVGLWQFELTAKRPGVSAGESEKFVVSRTISVGNSPAAQVISGETTP